MISKDTLLAAMHRECDLCLHLAGKVPEGGLEFRFSPGQRSTLELLRYLSFVGLGASHALLDGNFDRYQELAAAAESLQVDGIAAALEAQKQGLTELFEGLSEEDLAERRVSLPWGAEASLGEALLELPYACLASYRLQLFLQAKAAGAEALSTYNAWGGRDAPDE